MTEKINNIEFMSYEPKLANRWILKVNDDIIPSYLFHELTLYNDDDNVMLDLSHRHVLENNILPTDYYRLHTIELQFLDAIGQIVGGFIANISSIKYKISLNYSDDANMLTKLTIKLKNINPLHE